MTYHSDHERNCLVGYRIEEVREAETEREPLFRTTASKHSLLDAL